MTAVAIPTPSVVNHVQAGEWPLFVYGRGVVYCVESKRDMEGLNEVGVDE